LAGALPGSVRSQPRRGKARVSSIVSARRAPTVGLNYRILVPLKVSTSEGSCTRTRVESRSTRQLPRRNARPRGRVASRCSTGEPPERLSRPSPQPFGEGCTSQTNGTPTPLVLTESLGRSAADVGARFRTNSPVASIRMRAPITLEVVVGLQTIRSRYVVIAAGVGTRILVRALGVELPLVAGRGYSVDVTEQPSRRSADRGHAIAASCGGGVHASDELDEPSPRALTSTGNVDVGLVRCRLADRQRPSEVPVCRERQGP
jgi:hypothetical protein